tara:strand:- start:1010 stop:1618 length:609 start_codon:yes stop_codon:yes gene_type:complete
MKKILFGLIILFVGTQLMTSCSSESNVLSQFSKRKYMKRFKSKDVKYKDEINKRENDYAAVEKVEEISYASVEVEPTSFNLNEIEVVDKTTLIDLKEEKFEEQERIVQPLVDYSKTYKVNQISAVSRELFINNYISNNSAASNSSVNEIVLAILCVFIPPLAVYLYEDTITTNFWIDLIATLLFWFPGMILAFLMVFGGVSF